MCILRIPQHPWCYCIDPLAVDAFGNLKCTHHIWIRPDSIPLPPGTTTATTSQQSHLDALLTNIPRPGPQWEHCTEYTTTDPHVTANDLDSCPTTADDDELLCPETLRLKAASIAYQHVYAWNGLCAHCSEPDNHNGIALSLFPLRDHWVVPDEDDDDDDDGKLQGAGPPGETWEELVRNGFEMFDGSKVHEKAEKRLTRRDRTACDGGEGVYVDVVEGRWVGGGRAVYQGMSGVYLMPGYYDPALVSGMGKKKGWFGVRLGVVG